MPTPISIVSLSDLISVVVLIFLHVRMRKRITQKSMPSLWVFSAFLVSVTIELLILSLIGTIVTDLYYIQIVANFANFAFYVTVASFFRFILLFIGIEDRILYSVIPFAVILVGAAVLLRGLIIYVPAIPVTMTFMSVPLIFYEDASPMWANIIIGFLGLTSFGSGAFLFIRNGIKMQEPLLKRKSFLIGFGCVTAVATSFFNWLFVTIFNTPIFFFFASMGVLASLLLIYSGATSRVTEK